MGKIVLSGYYKPLLNPEKKWFREQVIEKTGISAPAFYDKMRNGKWTKAEQFIISLVLNKKEDDIIFN